ncbi:MAG: cyclase family protein [Bacteroidales bacterium]|nr:cyclase family protein [Bacteroidales bacterium]
MKIVDLTILLEEELPCDPPIQIPHIERWDHKKTAPGMKDFFPGTTEADLPEGNGWAVDFVKLCTHSGTHMDAPWHYYPAQNEAVMPGGEKAWTIEQVPLEWCVGPGVKLDFSDKPDGYKISRQDFIDKLAEIGHTLKPGEIVLLKSGAQGSTTPGIHDNRWGKKEYLVAGAGVSAEATEWMIDQGVHVCGTDGWSWDVPLPFEAEEFSRTKDKSIIWEGHRVGRRKAYCHIEKLANLDSIPNDGYTIYALPIPVKGCSAGWCRVVAIIE